MGLIRVQLSGGMARMVFNCRTWNQPSVLPFWSAPFWFAGAVTTLRTCASDFGAEAGSRLPGKGSSCFWCMRR